MTLRLAGIFSDAVSNNILFVAIGLVVFLVFLIGSRLIAQAIGTQLNKRHLPTGMIVLGRRVVTVLLLVIGVWAAVGFAIQSANVTLLGILLATVVAAFGVQDLLKDYVSGYYVLLEHHIRPGDRISMEGAGAGTVMEVRLRVTLLQTGSGDLLVVPNSELFGKAVTVHARAVERAAEASEVSAAKSEPQA